jgi:hypothetical protein
MIIVASPFTIKWIIEWYKIKKKFGVNILENPLANLSLIFTGQMKQYVIPKERLKAFRLALILHNIIYIPGVLFLFYIVIQLKK